MASEVKTGDVTGNVLMLRAYGKGEPMPFRVVTLEEVVAWSKPVLTPCKHCKDSKQSCIVSSQDRIDGINRLRKFDGREPLVLAIGDTYTFDCHCMEFDGMDSKDTTPSHVWFRDRHDVTRQAKVNGKVRTWKRDSRRVELPCKYGMWEYFTLDTAAIECGILLMPA